MSRTKSRGGAKAAQHRAQHEEAKQREAASVPNDKKRKLEDDETEHIAKKVATDTTPASNRPEQTEVDLTIANDSPEDLAKRYKEAIKKHKGDLSTIELEDLSLPATAFLDTIDFGEPRVVKNLSTFLQKFTPGGKEELSICKEIASPHTILLTSSAIRTTDLVRAVREYGTEDNKIAKLFAKHMKLKKMSQYVQNTRFGIGSGTPKRIQDLIEDDALKLDQLQRIILDASYIDNKKNTIFNHGEMFPQVLSLFTSERLNLRLHSNATKIIVF